MIVRNPGIPCFANCYLVVILHELDDDSDVVGVVLDGDDSHDVGCVLCVRILTVLVGQDKTSIGLMNLGFYI